MCVCVCDVGLTRHRGRGKGKAREDVGCGTDCWRAAAGAAHLHPMTSRIISSDATAAPSARGCMTAEAQCHIRRARRYEIN